MSNATKNSNNFHTIKSKWTWAILYTKLLFVLFMCLPLAMCQKQCKQTSKDEVIRWRTNPVSRVIEWRLDSVCSTYKECIGFSAGQNGIVPVQLCPVKVQEGDKVFVKTPPPTYPYPVRIANVSFSDWISCPNTTHPLDQRVIYDPTGQFSEIPSRFLRVGTVNLAQLPNGVFANCNFGLRLELTVKSQNCQRDSSETTLCSNNGICGSTLLESIYTCRCSEGYTGNFCEEFDACLSSPCKNGAKCTDVIGAESRNYTCKCKKGFRGVNCTEVIGPCSSSQCNNGTCVQVSKETHRCDCQLGFTGSSCDRVQTVCRADTCQNGASCVEVFPLQYSCQCIPGFTGIHCETSIDECASNPCHNNSVCIDLVNGFRCQCLTGYTGATCNETIDYCSDTPCENGGECVSSLTGYTCNCSFGFRGPNCDEIITRCTQFPDVCENGAHCIQSLTGPIKCQCSPGWTGATCGSVDNLCLYSPCKSNSTCVDTSKPEGPGNYKCLCAPGYTGRDCEQDIDECASNPCQNGATCHQGVNFYNCTCPLGYNGTNCENNIDVCAGREDQLCLNGGRCVDGDVGLEYTCNCLPGFRGSNCGVNINECESSPCQNNATCQDQVNRFFCNCTQGYFGERCESDVDHCTAQPCQNGGRCVTVLGSYRCECTGGWGGVNCTTDVDECTSQPCQNGAQCVDRLNEYSCECPVGFSGINCETNINDCKNDSCLNGATCVDLVNGFRCDCAPGFTDQTCSTDVDECISRPCQNGGECVDQINGYQCKCDSQLFGGNQCEVALNNCSFYPCQHNSTCTPTTSSTYVCNCADRYTGQNCETYLPFCPQRPCQNNATCTDIEEAKNYTCTCSPGYTGRNCEVDINFCQQHNCSQNSVCVDGITNYTCICFPGYTGQFCEMEIKECAPSPCQNGATCQDRVNGYSCSCVPGFTGLHCSTNIDDCVSEPCQNNGTCIDDVNAYRCRCVPGYSGINCETDLDLCGIGVCNNATNCTEINNGQNVTCTCLPGFTGYFCEVDIDDCSTSPCPDGATCVDGVNSYQCLCAGGVNCSSSVNECSSNPCQNGATCVDGIARFSCTCPLGFTGQLCEVNVDECGSSPCQNGGKCVDEVNGYRCNCSAGFSGIHCESNTDECLSSPCQNGGTCRDVVNGYICDCVQPFVGHDCSLLPCDLNPCGRNANCTNDLSVIPDGFTCQCPSGFKGKRCQSNIDDCDLADGSDPCSGRGFCVDGVDSFTCFCQPGWKGSRCEKPANDCFSNECKNNATCVDDSNGYHCKCLTGYAGEFCEKEADECETSPCKNGATCSDLFNDYSCLCRSGWTGKNCTEEVNECVFNRTTNPCLNNGTCVDIFNNFTCLCAPFYTGRLCEKRYDPCDDSYNQCRNNATCSTRSDGSYQCNCTTGWTGQNCEFRLSTPDSSIPAPTETAVSQTVSVATTTPILPSVSLETTQSGPDISTMQPTMTATTLPDTSGDLEFSTSTQIMPTRTISIDSSVKVTMSSTISPSPTQSADSTLSITPSLTSSLSLTPSVLTSVSPTPGLPSSLSPTPSVSISTSLMVRTPSSIAMTSSLPDTVSVTSSPPESSMSPFPSLPTSVIISPSITTSGTFDYSDFLETSMFGVIDSTTVLGSVLGKGSSVGEITSGVGGSMSSLFPSTAAEVGTLPTIYSSTQEMQSTVTPQILSSAVITQSPEGGSTVQPASPPLSVASTIADSDKMSALVQESMVTESSSMKADQTVSVTLVPSTTPSIEEVISVMSTPVLGSETALPSETITMHSEIPVISDSSIHLMSPSSDQSKYSIDLTTPHTDLSFAFTNTPLSSLFTVSTVSSTYTSGSPTEISSYTSSLDYPTSLTDKVQPTVSTGIMVTSTDTGMSSVGLDSYTPLVSTSARTDMDMSTRAQEFSSQDGLVTPMQTLVMSDSLTTETSRYDVQTSSSMLTESEVVAVTPTSVSASFDVMDSTMQKQSKQESEILLPTSLFSDMTLVVMETSDISLPVFTTTFSLSGSGTLPTYLSSTGLSELTSSFSTETVGHFPVTSVQPSTQSTHDIDSVALVTLTDSTADVETVISTQKTKAKTSDLTPGVATVTDMAISTQTPLTETREIYQTVSDSGKQTYVVTLISPSATDDTGFDETLSSSLGESTFMSTISPSTLTVILPQTALPGTVQHLTETAVVPSSSHDLIDESRLLTDEHLTVRATTPLTVFTSRIEDSQYLTQEHQFATSAISADFTTTAQKEAEISSVSEQVSSVSDVILVSPTYAQSSAVDKIFSTHSLPIDRSDDDFTDSFFVRPESSMKSGMTSSLSTFMESTSAQYLSASPADSELSFPSLSTIQAPVTTTIMSDEAPSTGTALVQTTDVPGSPVTMEFEVTPTAATDVSVTYINASEINPSSTLDLSKLASSDTEYTGSETLQSTSELEKKSSTTIRIESSAIVSVGDSPALSSVEDLQSQYSDRTSDRTTYVTLIRSATPYITDDVSSFQTVSPELTFTTPVMIESMPLSEYVDPSTAQLYQSDASVMSIVKPQPTDTVLSSVDFMSQDSVDEDLSVSMTTVSGTPAESTTDTFTESDPKSSILVSLGSSPIQAMSSGSFDSTYIMSSPGMTVFSDFPTDALTDSLTPSVPSSDKTAVFDTVDLQSSYSDRLPVSTEYFTPSTLTTQPIIDVSSVHDSMSPAFATTSPLASESVSSPGQDDFSVMQTYSPDEQPLSTLRDTETLFDASRMTSASVSDEISSSPVLVIGSKSESSLPYSDYATTLQTSYVEYSSLPLQDSMMSISSLIDESTLPRSTILTTSDQTVAQFVTSYPEETTYAFSSKSSYLPESEPSSVLVDVQSMSALIDFSSSQSDKRDSSESQLLSDYSVSGSFSIETEQSDSITSKVESVSSVLYEAVTPSPTGLTEGYVSTLYETDESSLFEATTTLAYSLYEPISSHISPQSEIKSTAEMVSSEFLLSSFDAADVRTEYTVKTTEFLTGTKSIMESTAQLLQSTLFNEMTSETLSISSSVVSGDFEIKTDIAEPTASISVITSDPITSPDLVSISTDYLSDSVVTGTHLVQPESTLLISNSFVSDYDHVITSLPTPSLSFISSLTAEDQHMSTDLLVQTMTQLFSAASSDDYITAVFDSGLTDITSVRGTEGLTPDVTTFMLNPSSAVEKASSYVSTSDERLLHTTDVFSSMDLYTNAYDTTTSAPMQTEVMSSETGKITVSTLVTDQLEFSALMETTSAIIDISESALETVFPTETVPLDSTVVISPTVTPSVEPTMIVTTPSPGVETCADSPCMNNATCVDSKNGGFAFRCVCDIRYEGQRCETARRTLYAQFNNTGYIQFDSPILQDTNTIQLSFYTTEENGLLFYSSKDYAITDDTNFIKLFTDKGILMYAFSCVMQHFNIDTKVKVNTGSLFNVTINQTSTCKASVKVSGPGAHSVVAEGTDFVFPTFKLSNLSDVYLGGVPTNTSILPQNHNHSSQFSGCITDFVLNNEAYGLINSSALEGVELCGTVSPKPDPTCVNVTCDNGGTCRDVVDASTGQKRFKCDCPLHFTGQTCEEEISVYFPKFNGQSYLQHNPMNLSLSATNEIIISFKTNSTDGTLLYSAALNAEGNFVHLFIDKSVLKYQLSCGQANILSVDTLTPVSNDNLTTVVIKQSIGSNRCSVSVQIDNNEPVTTVLTTSQQPPQADLGPLYLGGLPNGVTPSAKASPFVNFVGCIRNLQVNSVERLVFKDAVAGQNIEDCNVALCSYQPCKNGATCQSDGESWYCDCRPGYTGSLCERQLCDINPCRHGGTCVMLQEKGSYVCLCPYGRQGVTCEDELQITAPSYVGLQYGYPSYVAYSKISDMETAFEMKFQFTLAASATSLQSGLMIYTGGDGKSDSDYMAVGIQSGHVVFQFDLGSGAVSIQSEQSIAQDNTTHTVYLGRYRRAGWLQVDGQQNMTGSSPGKLDGLNIFSDFYMGGYETFNLNLLPAAVNYSNSFQGCLWNFQIKTPSTSSAFTTPGQVQSGRNIQQCRLSACKLNQCLNGAQCFDLGASFRCNCTDGWKGALCADRFTLCDGGHDCASGSTCVPLPSGGFTCQCLLGRSGPKCDQNLTISDPRFEGEESYMTFQPLRNMRNLTNVRLQFKPKTLTGLMFYVAQHLKSRSGDFLAISLNKGYVELRYNLGAYPTAVIKSKMKVSNETDKWYTLEVGRDIRQGYVRLENSDLALGNSPPGYVALDTSTRLYLGGVPNLEDIASSAVENEPSAFEGCIRELIVNNRPYKLTERGALGGINVGDCDGTGCGYSVCENNGTCQVAPGSKFSCQCPTNYFGETCGTHILCKNHQCENAGICVADESRQTYTCACQLGWAGSRCEQAIQFEAAQFTGNSYIYFLDRNYSNDSVYSTDLSFNFTTSAENGVILWNGQVYSDQDDYLGIGLIGGRLRICWNLGWWSRDEVVTTETVNDNQWHSVIVQRVNQSLTLYLDGKAYLSRVSGSFIGLDTMGIYYLGSFGLEESVSEHTNNHFTSAYTGCLQHLRIGQESSAISLQHTDRGINILKCAS